MAKNKIIFGGEVQIDLTQDTVTPDKLAAGYTAHDKSGEIITGTNTYDADTSDADAFAAEILEGASAYVNGVKVEGAMTNNGSTNHTITDLNEWPIPQGFHDGGGKVKADPTNIIPSNIRAGVQILGVTGTMSGSEGITAQAKEVTPTKSAQTVTPDPGYTYLSQVKVKGIPYTETANAAGGITVTIG